MCLVGMVMLCMERFFTISHFGSAGITPRTKLEGKSNIRIVPKHRDENEK